MYTNNQLLVQNKVYSRFVLQITSLDDKQSVHMYFLTANRGHKIRRFKHDLLIIPKHFNIFTLDTFLLDIPFLKLFFFLPIFLHESGFISIYVCTDQHAG